MTTIALVHGAWHGAWCWSPVVPHLEAAGHRVIAMDLPCDDATATFETYADVVLDELQHETDDLILVGHSLAGYTIPLVASRRDVRALVYVCALVPTPGRSYVQQLDDEPDMILQGYQIGMERDELGRGRWIDEAVARRVLYEDCEEQASHAAFSRLRPQSTALYSQPCSLAALPSTPSTYVVCSADRLVNPSWSRRTVGERLPSHVVELPGSHSPFLSRPADLAEVLLRAVDA